MTVVATIGSCELDLTRAGFVVLREGAPVPPQVHPPAVLVFFSKSDARQLAEALERDDQVEVHQVIKRGRWWRG